MQASLICPLPNSAKTKLLTRMNRRKLGRKLNQESRLIWKEIFKFMKLLTKWKTKLTIKKSTKLMRKKKRSLICKGKYRMPLRMTLNKLVVVHWNSKVNLLVILHWMVGFSKLEVVNRLARFNNLIRIIKSYTVSSRLLESYASQ